MVMVKFEEQGKVLWIFIHTKAEHCDETLLFRRKANFHTKSLSKEKITRKKIQNTIGNGPVAYTRYVSFYKLCVTNKLSFTSVTIIHFDVYCQLTKIFVISHNPKIRELLFSYGAVFIAHSDDFVMAFLI